MSLLDGAKVSSILALSLSLRHGSGDSAAGSPSRNRGHRYRDRDAHHGNRETARALGNPAHCPHGQSAYERAERAERARGGRDVSTRDLLLHGQRHGDPDA